MTVDGIGVLLYGWRMFSNPDSPSEPASNGAHHNESFIVAQCLEWLALHRVYAWRNNTGACKLDGRWLKYGHPGSSDILGISVGTMLCVECKTPIGRQSKAQKLFQAMIEKNGGIYILARSSNELERHFIENPRFASLGLDLGGRS